MKTWPVWVAAVLWATAAAQEPARVAAVFGEHVTRAETEHPADDEPPAVRLLGWIWQRIVPSYVAEHGLAATAAEVAELEAYEREFRKKDRAQRARKLEELNGRLASGSVPADQRARVEEFRAILLRMAKNDLELDRAPPGPPGERNAFYARVIERWKMDESLHRRYGGVVSLTQSGHSPHGARAALIIEYEERGWIVFHDPALRQSAYERLLARPSMIVPPHQVDFTPNWRRPIPPSYFPD